MTLTGGHGAGTVVDFVADGDTVGKGFGDDPEDRFLFHCRLWQETGDSHDVLVTAFLISTTGRSLGGWF